jgi:hypothetical protein
MNEIRIHQPGTRTTDYGKAEQIQKRTPNSFKKAQHVLKYAAKYVKNRGLFSSEKSRAQNLQNAIYDLEKALDQDSFMLEEKKTKGKAWVLIEYFSLFSDTFPNWQNEYKALNKFIPKCFSKTSKHSSNSETTNLKEKVANGIKAATKDIVTDEDSAVECNEICTTEEGAAWLYTEVMIQKMNALAFVVWSKWGENYDWADGDFMTENLVQGIYRNHDQPNISTTLMDGFMRLQRIEGEGLQRLQKVYESSANLVLKRDPNVRKQEITNYLDNKVEQFIKGFGKYFG